jgi:hypothetical protein
VEGTTNRITRKLGLACRMATALGLVVLGITTTSQVRAQAQSQERLNVQASSDSLDDSSNLLAHAREKIAEAMRAGISVPDLALPPLPVNPTTLTYSSVAMMAESTHRGGPQAASQGKGSKRCLLPLPRTRICASGRRRSSRRRWRVSRDRRPASSIKATRARSRKVRKLRQNWVKTG